MSVRMAFRVDEVATSRPGSRPRHHSPPGSELEPAVQERILSWQQRSEPRAEGRHAEGIDQVQGGQSGLDTAVPTRPRGTSILLKHVSDPTRLLCHPDPLAGEQHVEAPSLPAQPEPAGRQPSPRPAPPWRDHLPAPPGQEHLSTKPDRDRRQTSQGRQGPHVPLLNLAGTDAILDGTSGPIDQPPTLVRMIVVAAHRSLP